MICLLALLWSVQDGAAAPPAAEAPKADSSSWLEPVRGTLRVKYRYRATSGDSDTDLYEILTLSYGNAEKDPVTAFLSARLAEDLDGGRNVQGYSPFTSLDDKYHSSATQRLYTAYVDFHPANSGVLVRAGRQVLDDLPESVPMDGGSVRWEAVPTLTVSVFGGIPVNPFEASPAGDAMYGGRVEWRPDPAGRGRFGAEYLHVKDENVFGLHDDDLVGFTMDEGEGPFTIHARYTLLEGNSRDLAARVSAAVPDAGFLADVQGTYVFHRIEALSYALDPYASFMMDLQPYVDLTFRASKSFGSEVVIDATFTTRELARGGSDSPYNHEFKRVGLTPRLLNWPLDGVTLSVTADYWNSTADDFWTLGGDLSWAPHRDIVLGVGTGYALYSIDAFTGEEHERVRTLSVTMKWKVSKGSSLDLRWTLEDSSIGTFRTLEVGFRHAF